MTKKWYNYFVTVDEGSAAVSAPAGAGANPQRTGLSSTTSSSSSSAAQTVAEIASSVATEPKFTSPVSNPTSFNEIYKAAESPIRRRATPS